MDIKHTMSDDMTHFQLNLNGISLELSGEREFVEFMYRRIMRDVEEAKRRMLDSEHKSQQKSSSRAARRAHAQPPDDPVIWLHRCNDMVHKIYMASPENLKGAQVFSSMDLSVLSRIYLQDPLLSRVLPRFDRGQTLWAELTAAGRQKIAEATGNYKALKANVDLSKK